MSAKTQKQDSPPAADGQVTLQVGERQFLTTRSTLVRESGFFASLLSGRWDNGREDGSYFIDADANLFEHILRYLRRGVLPVFYDKARGHDNALYLALLEEAKYFQIPRLIDWLEREHYVRALKIEHTAYEADDVEELCVTRDTESDVEYYPTWKAEKVYVCPRGIPVHRGDPRACGKNCWKVQGDADSTYEEEQVLRTLVVKKRTVLDSQACLAGR